MAKNSGHTRRVVVAREDETPNYAARQKFSAYDTSKWEHTYYNDKTGGFLVTDRRRITIGQMNKQEKYKFKKEQRMSEQFADFGFQIEHLAEEPGISSHDTNVVSFGRHNSIVRVNGVKADLKSLSSHNNIRRHANEAIYKQGAEIILFEFTSTKHRGKIISEIKKLSSRGIHGYFYFTGNDKPTQF